MIYGDLQIYDILIFAAIAAFLVFRLKNVLGKRTGYQKNSSKNPINDKTKITEENQNQPTPDLETNISELKKAYGSIKDFDHKNFLEGAKNAYETIINAFNKNDKKTLKDLLTRDVYSVFSSEIDNGNTDPNNQFFSLNIERVESVIIDKDFIKIKILFVSEQFQNNDESKKTKKEDSWTFEKSLSSKNPNWLLSST